MSNNFGAVFFFCIDAFVVVAFLYYLVINLFIGATDRRHMQQIFITARHMSRWYLLQSAETVS